MSPAFGGQDDGLQAKPDSSPSTVLLANAAWPCQTLSKNLHHEWLNQRRSCFCVHLITLSLGSGVTSSHPAFSFSYFTGAFPHTKHLGGFRQFL